MGLKNYNNKNLLIKFNLFICIIVVFSNRTTMQKFKNIIIIKIISLAVKAIIKSTIFQSPNEKLLNLVTKLFYHKNMNLNPKKTDRISSIFKSSNTNTQKCLKITTKF